MKILITGAAGYLGSQLSRYLLSEGHHVIAFDNMTYGCEGLLFGAHDPNLQIVRGDIRHPHDITSLLEKSDCLICLAGIVGEPACGTNPEISRQINYDGNRSVIAHALQVGLKKIIFISTCSNYGVSAPNELADEHSPLNPLSEYARAKVDIENYILDAASDRCTILRLGTLCGLSARMRFDLLVNDLAKSIALNQEILIYAPEAWRPYLTIRDAMTQIGKVAISDWNYNAGPVFNLVGENLRKSDLVDFILKYHPDAKISYRGIAPDLRDYRVSGMKFERHFATTPSTSIESTLIEVTQAVSNGFFIDPQSRRFTAFPPTPLV